MSVLVAAAVAKMLAGRAGITFVRVAEILGGRTKRTDAMLLIVEARRVTTLLASGARVGGIMTALPLPASAGFDVIHVQAMISLVAGED